MQVKSLIKDNRGAVAAITIIMMVAFFALLAIVIDVGHLMLVRSQLQNAADAGALAGAETLFFNNLTNTPAWAAGQAAANSTVQSNKADTQYLLTATAQAGYWDTTWTAATAPANLLPTGIVPGPTDAPAVKVSVEKIAGSNNGPVALTFGQIFGLATVNVGAHATALICNPGTVPPGGLFPLAITSAILTANVYTNFGPGNKFSLFSSYHTSSGLVDQAGQWTSFGADDNNVPTIRNLMANGNPNPVSVGGDIWVEPGTKTTLFDDAANYIGETVLLPVVSGDLTTHAFDPIIGFVPFVITGAAGGSVKDITGYFTGGIIAPGSACGGPNFGAYTPPFLVQ
jgi:Flp pilus assembly protein TadG